MPDSLMLLVALVAVALIFDFLNGLHDAANSIATVVSTRVLSPNVAVVWAAFFNFIAFLFFGLHVAQTVGTGIISPDIVDGQVIFGALMGAIVWNLLTWWGAIPSSSSHALIGRKYNHRLGDHTARRGADRGSVLRVRGPFCCGRLTPFGGRLTRQPCHISARLFYDRRSSRNP